MKQYTNQEIVDYVMNYFGYASQMELAKALGCANQNIYQFKRNAGSHINTMLISMLIEELEKSA